MTRPFLIILAALFASACATPAGIKYSEVRTEIPAVSADKGRIFFYRDTWMGSALSPNIKLNEKVIGESHNGQMFFYDTSPGHYKVEMSTEASNEVEFDLAAAECKYVRVDISMGFFVGHPKPKLIDNKTAEEEVTGLRLIGWERKAAPVAN